MLFVAIKKQGQKMIVPRSVTTKVAIWINVFKYALKMRARLRTFKVSKISLKRALFWNAKVAKNGIKFFRA